MITKTIVGLLATVFVAAGCQFSVQCGTDDGLGEAPDRYENDELGFAFDVPEGWRSVTAPVTSEELGSPPIAQVAFGDLNRETGEINGVLVSVYRLLRPVPEGDLEDALSQADAFFAQLAGQAGGQLVSSEDTVLDGRPARRYVLDFLYLGEAPTRSEFVLTFIDDLEYLVNCQAEEPQFDQVRVGCDEVEDTFQFTAP